MNCPFCGGSTQVKDSRPSGDDVRRRRECKECERRFTTFESVAPLGLKVAKADGRLEEFDEAKVRRVLARVCRDRGIPEERLRAVARRLEAELAESERAKVRSGDIARGLLNVLRDLDSLAAERFALNYQDGEGHLDFDRATATEEPPPQLDLFSAGPGPEPGA
jgi:transcriptional repressor NrdR